MKKCQDLSQGSFALAMSLKLTNYLSRMKKGLYRATVHMQLTVIHSHLVTDPLYTKGKFDEHAV